MTAEPADDEDEDVDTRPDVFRARYRGACADCGSRIDPGDLIYAYRVPAGDPGQYVHAHCPDLVDVAPIRAGETRCPVCTAHHPGVC